LILARQSSRHVALKKEFSVEEEDFAEDEDAATFSEELLTGFDDEDEDFSEDEDAANFSDDELFVDF